MHSGKDLSGRLDCYGGVNVFKKRTYYQSVAAETGIDAAIVIETCSSRLHIVRRLAYKTHPNNFAVGLNHHVIGRSVRVAIKCGRNYPISAKGCVERTVGIESQQE